MAAVLSQIVGVFVIVAVVVAPHLKNKRDLLLVLLLANALTVVQFALLGAATEVAVITVSTFRTLVFYLYSRREMRAPLWVFVGICVLQGGAVALTWKSALSLLMLFDMVQTYGQWQTNMKVLRVCTIIAAIPIGIYNFAVKGYMGAINQAGQAVSASYALWNLHYRKRE